MYKHLPSNPNHRNNITDDDPAHQEHQQSPQPQQSSSSSTALVPLPPSPKKFPDETNNALALVVSSPINRNNTINNNSKVLSYPRSRSDFIYSLDKLALTTTTNNILRHNNNNSQQVVSKTARTTNQLSSFSPTHPKNLTREAVLSIAEVDQSFAHRSRGRVLPPLALELSSFVRREHARIDKYSSPSSSSSSPKKNNNNSPSGVLLPSVTKEKLTTVRETINCLANHFPDYNEVFGQLLFALDESLLESIETEKRMSELQLFRNSSDSIVEQKIHEVKVVYERQMEAVRTQSEKNKEMLKKANAEVEKAVGDSNFFKRRLTEKTREFEEALTRAQMFQHAMEEETKRSIDLTRRLSRLTATNKQLRSNVDFMDQLLKDAESQIEKSKHETQQQEKKKDNNNMTDLLAKSKQIVRMTTENLGDNDNGDNNDDEDNNANNDNENNNEFNFDDEDSPDEPVPRRMDDVVLSQLTNWKEKLFHLDVKVKRLAAINNELMDDKAKLQERIETLKDGIAKQNEALTPRPNWIRVNEVLPRFSLNSVASSDETLDDVLLLCQQELNSVRHEAEARIMGNVVHEFLGEENLCESDLVGHTKHFIARGTAPHVPVYLRATGIIKNRRMRKYGCEAVLKKFWTARRKYLGIPAPSVAKLLMANLKSNEASSKDKDVDLLHINPNSAKQNKKKHLHLLHRNINQHLQSLLHPHQHHQQRSKDHKGTKNNADESNSSLLGGAYYSGGKANKTPIDYFFIEFLTELTGSTKLGVELAYNVLAICEQYSSDADCNAILRVLRGEISEFIIYDQIDMLVKLEAAMHSVDISKKGKLSRSTIHRVLHLMFPAKSKEDMLRLRLNLAISCGGDQMVDLNALFKEDDEANQSRFVETLRSQHLDEVVLFGVEVEEALRETTRIMNDNNNNTSDALSLNNTNTNNLTNSSDFIDAALAKTALHAIDPLMPEHIVSEIIAAGCNIKSGRDLDEMLFQRSDVYSSTNNNKNANNATTTSSSYSALKYPIEPFLERIRKNVLVKRYGKRPGHENEDVFLGGVLSATAEGSALLSTAHEQHNNKHSSKKGHNNTKTAVIGSVSEDVNDDDDDQFFKFMQNLHDEDEEEEEEEEDANVNRQTSSTMEKKKSTLTLSNRRKSLVDFARIAGSNSGRKDNQKSSIDENANTTDNRRRSIYKESQLDKLLQDESDDDDDELDSLGGASDNNDDEESKKQSLSFLKRKQSFQRKVDLGESTNVDPRHQNHRRLSSMTNVVTAAVAAENLRRVFQKSVSDREAERRQMNNNTHDVNSGSDVKNKKLKNAVSLVIPE